MKKNILLFVFVLLSITSSAQKKLTTGYMGKRFSLLYENFMMPATAQITEKAIIKFSHLAEIDYVFNYRKAICLSFSYTPLQVTNSFKTRTADYIFDKSDYYEKCNSFGVAVALKLFRRTRFAPLGGYVKWELVYLVNKLKVKAYTTKTDNGSYYHNTIKITDYPDYTLSIASAGPTFAFGKQRVFFDKMIVDYGLRGGLIVSLLGNNGYDKNNLYERSLFDNLTNEVLLQHFINIRVGIGFLPF